MSNLERVVLVDIFKPIPKFNIGQNVLVKDSFVGEVFGSSYNTFDGEWNYWVLDLRNGECSLFLERELKEVI